MLWFAAVEPEKEAWVPPIVGEREGDEVRLLPSGPLPPATLLPNSLYPVGPIEAGMTGAFVAAAGNV